MRAFCVSFAFACALGATQAAASAPGCEINEAVFAAHGPAGSLEEERGDALLARLDPISNKQFPSGVKSEYSDALERLRLAERQGQTEYEEAARRYTAVIRSVTGIKFTEVDVLAYFYVAWGDRPQAKIIETLLLQKCPDDYASLMSSLVRLRRKI